MKEHELLKLIDDMIVFYGEDALYWARQNNRYLAERYENYVRLLTALRNTDAGNILKVRAFMTEESKKWAQDPITILTRS